METYGLVTGVEHSGSVQLWLVNLRMSLGVRAGVRRRQPVTRVEKFGAKQLPVKRRDKLMIA